MRTLIVMLMLALLAPMASADRRGTPQNPPGDRREKIKKKIRALRAYTLTEELALDDKTAARLFPVLARWDDVTDKLLVSRADLTRQLQGSDAIKDPKVLDKLIDDAVANQKAFWDLEDKRLIELRKLLTPGQTARLLIVLPAFERRIQNQLRKAIQKGQGPRRNAADLDDEGDEEDDEPAVRPGRPGRAGPRAPAPSRAPGNSAPKPCDPFSSPTGC